MLKTSDEERAVMESRVLGMESRREECERKAEIKEPGPCSASSVMLPVASLWRYYGAD